MCEYTPFLCKHLFYENIEAEIGKILSIFQESQLLKERMT